MTERPRLLIVSFSDISSDARVLKQVNYLAPLYDVTTLGYGESPHAEVRHLSIADGTPFRSHTRSDLILRRYRSIYWNSPAVLAALALVADAAQFDLVLANDIETVGLALRLAPRHGVHADVHEYAPRQNDEDTIWRYFVAPFVRWMCRRFLTKASSVTTVAAGIAAEYHREFGIEAGVATNAAPYTEALPSAVSSPIRLVHSGAALRNRRLEALIEAAATTRTPVSLDLYLMPNDPAYVEELRALAAASPAITVHDPLPYSELVAQLVQYDVGLPVIPPVNYSYRWSLPNKFFDYVQARLAIITGPSPEMRTWLEDFDLGIVAHGFDGASIAAALDTLTIDDVVAWKANSHAAARELSSEQQVHVWGDALTRLLSS